MPRSVISKSMEKRLRIQNQKPKWRHNYETVLMPITVPIGKYCWNQEPPHQVCMYFNNEHGHPGCELGLYPLVEENSGSVLKPKTCLNFKKEEV